MNDSTSLAINEFTFRYLYPLEDEKQWRPLNALEMACQRTRRQPGCSVDISELVTAALTHQQCPRESVIERLIFALAQVHLPNYVTTADAYGSHAEYPSPRSYYPLTFSVQCPDSPDCWREIDLENWQLNDASHRDTLWLADSIRLRVNTDFHIYNALYNRFRYGLFCLELGHCLRALTRRLARLGLTARLQRENHQFLLDITRADSTTDDDGVNLSRRTSGMFTMAFFPARSPQIFCNWTR
ncbi:hypothetical protein CS022_21300 [Veronia nyctiphanis]|uniref:Uncharacterized protein n=1 Tax=Veronia nyctiphanis TaxID=1278244 RepID=A0A4Q0YLE5_9GAMM|nr:hypothetical protein [Veronia nyctiphanis]RXJ71205.1 hypothetical protein CS022_21300 [Veronia nyctiphanis]